MKNVTIYIMLFLAVFALNAYSQRQTDVQALIDMAERKANEHQQRKAEALEFARENDIPFLGLCLGLQLSVIEFLRNV